MKSVDRPLANPKRITIESSQEFFSVEILCSVSTADPPNTKHYVHRPAPIERPAVIHEANDKTRSGDDDDDFMTRTKKRNATGSPIKILRKTCTKRMKVVETPRHAVCSPVFFFELCSWIGQNHPGRYSWFVQNISRDLHVAIFPCPDPITITCLFCYSNIKSSPSRATPPRIHDPGRPARHPHYDMHVSDRYAVVIGNLNKHKRPTTSRVTTYQYAHLCTH
jgi:hypothetical protein